MFPFRIVVCFAVILFPAPDRFFWPTRRRANRIVNKPFRPQEAGEEVQSELQVFRRKFCSSPKDCESKYVSVMFKRGDVHVQGSVIIMIFFSWINHLKSAF